MKKKVVGMMFALFIVAGLGFIGSTGTSGGSVGTFELPSEY
ncbi:hypothetical protein [Peribacillus huizhouensis]|uniref:Phosphatase n=1 Tax=Peribacillus huizhouensis TaxID=1501239 RepID=A0ABR6CT61_9BACI|nr:hypothetical protein [Peribacillus huizhouensis]MBA9027838.1 hypothetical protein [Peribacillus huizhouensis]